MIVVVADVVVVGGGDNGAVAEDVAGDVVAAAGGTVSTAGNRVFEDREDEKRCPASRHPSPDDVIVASCNTMLDRGSDNQHSYRCISNSMKEYCMKFDSSDQTTTVPPCVSTPAAAVEFVLAARSVSFAGSAVHPMHP